MEDPGVYGRITLKWILEKSDGVTDSHVAFYYYIILIKLTDLFLHDSETNVSL